MTHGRRSAEMIFLAECILAPNIGRKLLNESCVRFEKKSQLDNITRTNTLQKNSIFPANLVQSRVLEVSPYGLNLFRPPSDTDVASIQWIHKIAINGIMCSRFELAKYETSKSAWFHRQNHQTMCPSSIPRSAHTCDALVFTLNTVVVRSDLFAYALIVHIRRSVSAILSKDSRCVHFMPNFATWWPLLILLSEFPISYQMVPWRRQEALDFKRLGDRLQ